jgi:hypothetical protein
MMLMEIEKNIWSLKLSFNIGETKKNLGDGRRKSWNIQVFFLNINFLKTLLMEHVNHKTFETFFHNYKHQKKTW